MVKTRGLRVAGVVQQSSEPRNVLLRASVIHFSLCHAHEVMKLLFNSPSTLLEGRHALLRAWTTSHGARAYAGRVHGTYSSEIRIKWEHLNPKAPETLRAHKGCFFGNLFPPVDSPIQSVFHCSSVITHGHFTYSSALPLSLSAALPLSATLPPLPRASASPALALPQRKQHFLFLLFLIL